MGKHVELPKADISEIALAYKYHARMVDALRELLKESESAGAEGRHIVQAEDKARTLLAQLDGELR